MKIIQLIQLSWKSFWRSPALTQNLTSAIIMGLFAVYMILNVVVVGYLVPGMVADSQPDIENHGVVIGKYYLYFILTYLLIRLVFQNYGMSAYKHLLVLAIPKRTLIAHVLLRSVFSLYNIIPILGILAYIYGIGATDQFNIDSIGRTLVVMVGLLFISHFLGYILDRLFSFGNKLLLILFAGCIMLALIYGTFYEALYMYLSSSTGIFLVLVALVFSVFGSYYVIRRSTYFEDYEQDQSSTVALSKEGYFSKYGLVGHLMDMEFKLMQRLPRVRAMAIIIPLMLFYPLLFGREDYGNTFDSPMLIFVSVFVTGGFALNYGQLLLSWNSDHLDLLMTKNIAVQNVFKAKYYLLSGIIFIQSVIMLPYGFYNQAYFYLIPAMMLYNIGVVNFFYMYLASYNSKKIDTSKGGMMNYEGLSLALFLIVIPIIVIPMGVIWLADWVGYPSIGLLSIGIIGAVALLLHERIIQYMAQVFSSNKYKIGAAFRKKA